MRYLILKTSGFLLLSTVLLCAQDSTKIQQLEERIKALEEKIEQSELEKLIKEAESLSREEEDSKETKIFRGGQRSLQAMNPELSIASDAYGQYIINENGFTEEARSGAYFRVAELQFQSNLDPFSFTKIILEFSPKGVEFAEAYITWSRLFENVSLTAGKFRQQFGVVNRWHAHALDQFDWPLAMTAILGEEGLNQTGLSFEWLMPAFMADANNLFIQVTNGENEHLFAGEMFSFPSTLARLTSYYDLSLNTYMEWGVTGMAGKSNRRGYDEDGELILESVQFTYLGGIDLTLLWEPTSQARYRSFLWRNELYYVYKNQMEEDIKAIGVYTYGEYQFDRSWSSGLRIDLTQPYKAGNKDKYLYQIVPCITWWQSPWVKVRLQYNYLNGTDVENIDQTLRLQLVWAVGPHKHDRY